MSPISSSAERKVRRQLSLYVPPDSARAIEAVRQTLDPVQSSLIPAHVTLCREDELDAFSLPQLAVRIADARPITLQFGRAEVFDGHGILLGCIKGQEEFQALREHVLGSREIRAARPHLTLAHPRNPKAPGNSPAAAANLTGISVRFDRICLIEQEGAMPWKLLRSFQLRE